jgi:hypothetical protein
MAMLEAQLCMVMNRSTYSADFLFMVCLSAQGIHLVEIHKNNESLLWWVICRCLQQEICVQSAKRRCMHQFHFVANMFSVKTVCLNGTLFDWVLSTPFSCNNLEYIMFIFLLCHHQHQA